MGFSKSFWNQMGRSTGKVASNMIFGDRWSTPYRRAGGREPRGRGRSTASGNGGRKVGCLGLLALPIVALVWLVTLPIRFISRLPDPMDAKKKRRRR